MITIESTRTTRDKHISNNPHTWERYPVTHVVIKDYDMDAPIDQATRMFHDSDMDCRPCEILEGVIIEHGDDGQAICNDLCKKYGLENRYYTTNHQLI